MVYTRGESSGACQGGWGWGIAKGTQHPEAVWKAIQFFSSTEAQRKIALDQGYLPSRRSVFNDTKIVEIYSHFPAV